MLDILRDAPVDDGHRARSSQEAYLQVRKGQLQRQQQLQAKQSSENLALERVSSVLFTVLPTVASGLFGSGPKCFLFNEHYVSKPPKSKIEFKWHTDEEEQLSAFATSGGFPQYLSAWCPLDQITEANGPLVLLPLPHTPNEIKEQGHDLDPNNLKSSLADTPAILPLLEPGSVVFFASSLWHTGTANSSESPRRVFYAQFSPSPIEVKGRPLAFAVPCTPWAAGVRAGRRAKTR